MYERSSPGRRNQTDGFRFLVACIRNADPFTVPDVAMTLRHGFKLGNRLIKPMENRISGPSGDRHVEPKAMEVLLCLAERAGEVVTRDEVSETVWGRAIVMDQALTNCISELRKSLGDSRSEPRFIATVPKRGYRLIAPVDLVAPNGQADPRSSERSPVRRAAWLATSVVALIGGVAVFATWTGSGNNGVDNAPDTATVATVAVVPFRQLSGGEKFSYLRFALPDEISTVLAQASKVAVRPFQPDAPDDPIEAGRELDAANLITGHYYVPGGDSLSITIEAVNVDADRILWHTRLTAPADDVLSIRNRIESRIRKELLPALGAPSLWIGGTRPSDADAYRIYLRSLAVSRDPPLNARGIEMLEEAVSMDPNYAPAWAALAERYHSYASYGGGGEAALERAKDAARQALELDPDLVKAAGLLITLQTEAGQLEAAYQQARDIVARRAQSAAAHFALAYVLRYGGMPERSQHHCEIAAALDPHYYGWRSCAFSFLLDGKLERAAEFIELDAGSYWADLATIQLRVRQGDAAGALIQVQQLPPGDPDRSFLVPCLQGRSVPSPAEAATAFAERWRRLADPEPAYWVASLLARCGRTVESMEMLRHAIRGGFCAYPALESDPIWDELRKTPGFQQVRGAAMACRERFRRALETRP